MIKEEWKIKGFVDEPIDQQIDIVKEIRRMCSEKNAIILAHYYVDGKIQDIADFIGDSLALARKAAKTDAKIIVMCGVHFMAETCKILSPEKLVLCPDLNAGCSLADSCNAAELKAFKQLYPDHTLLCYVNTTAEVKALTDIVVTSGNARKIVDQLPQDEKIIFAPDYNLGNYINSVTGRNMVLWNGGCHVHERFSVIHINQLKQNHPSALVLAHPECKEYVIKIADVVGSTAVLLDYCIAHPDNEYIVATESGILHEMMKKCPNTVFYAVATTENHDVIGSKCNDCEYMKMNTLEKIYNTLKYEFPSVEVPEDVAREAIKPIVRMLGMS